MVDLKVAISIIAIMGLSPPVMKWSNFCFCSKNCLLSVIRSFLVGYKIEYQKEFLQNLKVVRLSIQSLDTSA